MMKSARYGHIIKHLETTHLEALPVPIVSNIIAADFQRRAHEILRLRNRAYQLTCDAEKIFAEAVGPLESVANETGFQMRASELATGRRRLEASYYSPRATVILARLKACKATVNTLRDVTEGVWWMARFRRFYGDAGIPYLSADELFTTNPEMKRILVDAAGNHETYFVRRGWIVMACSGQVYGLNGAARLITEHYENVFFSHDLIRIIPRADRVRAGYLLTALVHPTHGRPLLIRAAYGTSIPHLDPSDVSNFPVVRLSASEETMIADLAEQSADERARADVLESQVAAEAGRLIERFLAGDTLPFVTAIPMT